MLLDMYRESFACEFHKEGDYSEFEHAKQIGETDFQKFCLGYEIVPFYISKAIASNLWENLLGIESSWLEQQIVRNYLSCLPLECTHAIS